MVGIVILASWKGHFIRVDENMVQHPVNNISIEGKDIYKLKAIKINKFTLVKSQKEMY